MDWFLVNRPDLLKYITVRRATGKNTTVSDVIRRAISAGINLVEVPR